MVQIPKLTVPILLTRRPLWRDQLWLVPGLGFDVVLCGELEDSGRGGDLRFGRLQDRLLAGRLHSAEGLAVVLARHDQPRALPHLGAELFTLHCWVADQGCCLGELAVCGWLQGVASGIADGDWFGSRRRW